MKYDFLPERYGWFELGPFKLWWHPHSECTNPEEWHRFFHLFHYSWRWKR